VNTGDTFLIELPGTSRISHLWILISDPTQSPECILVNLTSWREDKDPSCVLEAGDHSFIQHRTCVNFAAAKRVPIAWLEAAVQKGSAIPHQPAHAVLDRILEAIPNSRSIPLAIAQFLADQGMIDF
jgi:hypothetical protein